MQKLVVITSCTLPFSPSGGFNPRRDSLHSVETDSKVEIKRFLVLIARTGAIRQGLKPLAVIRQDCKCQKLTPLGPPEVAGGSKKN